MAVVDADASDVPRTRLGKPIAGVPVYDEPYLPDSSPTITRLAHLCSSDGHMGRLMSPWHREDWPKMTSRTYTERLGSSSIHGVGRLSQSGGCGHSDSSQMCKANFSSEFVLTKVELLGAKVDDSPFGHHVHQS
ncbi:1134_t:CDS:2 [Acaulospora colombiana]|uniref:1134_t:CDS:1 n=1 Tax=Acaulospora colombiana TaxID=27376 RepID=A0ACA9LUV9_9GLOM|nr:1134_t:CDS:2 [Acaulospora colombiana]